MWDAHMAKEIAGGWVRTLRGYLEYGADFDENNTATRQLREACETMLKNGVVLAELQGKSLRDSYLANPGSPQHLFSIFCSAPL